MESGPARIQGPPPKVYGRAIAAATISAGEFLRRDSAGLVEPADDGDFVVGLSTGSAEAGDMVTMIVEGPVIVRARTGSGLTAGRRIRVAPSSEVDEGSSELHYMGRLVYHDTDDDLASVNLRADSANMNELGEVENDLSFDEMVKVKQYALMMGRC